MENIKKNIRQKAGINKTLASILIPIFIIIPLIIVVYIIYKRLKRGEYRIAQQMAQSEWPVEC